MQIRIPLIGGIVGFVIGVLGGLASGNPFGVVLLRSLLTGIIAGAVVFGLHWLIQKFLPDLVAPRSPADPETVAEGVGNRVDIVLPGEDDYTPEPDQAAELRQTVAPTASEARPQAPANEPNMFADEDASSEESMIEEVPDHGSANLAEAAGFSEDAFYSGIERLPDIGGFSEQFDGGASAAESSETEGGGFDASSEEPVYASSKSSSADSGKNGPMDPELLAKAIRTALKKE